MKPNLDLQFYLHSGIVLITIINAAGAIASRQFNFRFHYLILLSIVFYTTTGYLISREISFFITPSCNAIFGCFDALMGWYFSKVLVANTGYSTHGREQFNVQISMITKVLLSIVCGFIGQRIVH